MTFHFSTRWLYISYASKSLHVKIGFMGPGLWLLRGNIGHRGRRLRAFGWELMWLEGVKR